MWRSTAGSEMPAVYFEQLFYILERERERGGGIGWRSLRIRRIYVTCKITAPVLLKRGLWFPLTAEKSPYRSVFGSQIWLAVPLSLFSIFRRWLLIRRSGILCQRVYTVHQHTVIVVQLCGKHAHILCNSTATGHRLQATYHIPPTICSTNQ